MTIDPAAAGPANVYKLMIGAIVPRPIAFVSTLSLAGVPNLAPFSFFTAASANPPVICFAPMVRGSDGQQKDTLNNIRETAEFVINIVSEDFASKMNVCSAEFPPDVDEWQKADLTPIPSDCVKPTRVAESRVHMECKLVDIISVSKQPLGGSLVLGEVVRFHVADELFDDYRIDPDLLQAIGRMGGPTYSRTKDRFDLQRPKL
ncbi:MAG TPA: flavin reductase family protein [Bryobacteraceae bacterium]|nr:flavin reductase family protein [Bryobacteraceae bacterium]